jgi:hypothetical protein
MRGPPVHAGGKRAGGSDYRLFLELAAAVGGPQHDDRVVAHEAQEDAAVRGCELRLLSDPPRHIGGCSEQGEKNQHDESQAAVRINASPVRETLVSKGASDTRP